MEPDTPVSLASSTTSVDDSATDSGTDPLTDSGVVTPASTDTPVTDALPST